MCDPAPVLDLIEAFRRSKAMFTAVSLGLFDLLDQQPATAVSLAASLQADLSALTRLLDACAGLGLLSKSGDLYSNTATASTFLVSSSPQTLAGYILYSDRALFPMWADLKGAVLEGTNRWQPTFGPLPGGIFAHFFRDSPSRAAFLHGMHGLGLLSSPKIVRIFNLSRFNTICDLGGATGHLAIAACERYGAMRGIVFELPQVIPHAQSYIDKSPAAARLRALPGDFFSDPLPPADLYALGRILHDWPEDRIRALLARIHDALPPGGAILIAETLLDDAHVGPVHSLMQSLNMLVCTEGRERSVPEYAALLESAGFSQIDARRTGAPLDALLAIRKQ
ncbi:MAG: homocysteine methyltransferase [Candidatus Solibacter sp.]|nr:homocysteine methyltransferase [Candidatus Solibacter sp.]